MIVFQRDCIVLHRSAAPLQQSQSQSGSRWDTRCAFSSYLGALPHCLLVRVCMLFIGVVSKLQEPKSFSYLFVIQTLRQIWFIASSLFPFLHFFLSPRLFFKFFIVCQRVFVLCCCLNLLKPQTRSYLGTKTNFVSYVNVPINDH